MASTVPFKLITPTKVVFEGDAELIIATTTEGEEGILPKHAPFLAALKPGVLRANVQRDGATTRLELATAEGFMQALPERVTVLVDAAFTFDEVDVAKAQQDLAQAQERQRAAPDLASAQREQVAIDLAGAQLRLTGHH